MRVSISKLLLSLKLIDEGTNSWQRMQRRWISLTLDTLNLPLLVCQHPDDTVLGMVRNCLAIQMVTLVRDKRETHIHCVARDGELSLTKVLDKTLSAVTSNSWHSAGRQTRRKLFRNSGI
jgi:hypothetical protein